MTNLSEQFRVPSGTSPDINKQDPASTAGYTEATALEELAEHRKALFDLQARLTAQDEQALLLVFQAMDSGGKDETVRDVFTTLNPAYCVVHSFTKPNKEEKAHDFLWRFHHKVPAKGDISIFNRSYYEEVLGAKVTGQVQGDLLQQRYDDINSFELYLSHNHITVLKFLFHISKQEQKRRLHERMTDPTKQWELSEADFEGRDKWDLHMDAFSGVLRECSTEHAPWYLIPANHEWLRNLAVAQIVRAKLEEIDPQYPPPSFDISQYELKD